ncbi:MAG: VOC family protein, partial [Proteobacteria bacterium]|nr:VOC family protein [Pseudomonadota bacterium]
AGNRAAGGVLPPGVHHLTLQSATLDDATAAVAAAGIEIAPPQLALHGRSAVELSAGRLGGVRLFLSEPPDLPKVTPGPVERIDHIGVASADNGAALAMYCDQLGFALESRQIDREIATVIETFSSDRYGVVRHSRPAVVAGGLRVAFVTIGDCELEFLENFNPDQDGAIDHGARGTTRQDQGAISRYIASRGAGLHHLAFKVADIDGLLASLAAKGYDVIDPVGRPGSRRARIGFIHPRSMGGLLLHLVERSELSGPAEPE